MTGRAPGRSSLLGSTILGGGAFYAAVWLWPGAHGHLLWKAGSIFFGLLAFVEGMRLLREGLRRLGNLITLIRALRSDDTRGSAGWLSERQARRAGLHRRRRGSRFIGVLGRTPLWGWTEVHQLVIGPAGSSKSAAAIITMLCSVAESALVNDTKGELYEVTAEFRRRRFRHIIVKLDPTDPETDCVNPLDLVHVCLIQDSPEALTLVRGMALQLYPEPAEEGQNKFFRAGSRRLIAAVVIAVVDTCDPADRTLATVYRALCDENVLDDLLSSAGGSLRLNGEVAAMADDIHQMAFGEDGAARTYEQFRIGAMGVLEAFGPGGYLARITATTTFSFADLKAQKVTCYLIIDHNNKDTLGRWSGLMQFLAAYQMVQARNNRPVHMILDEFCNAPLHGLPGILTLLRSYGVKCTMATQDLSDITRVYGKHALETIVSETDVKQFLGGIRSRTTLEFLSKYMGEYTEIAPSFALGEGGIQESIGRAARPLLTPDELRRLNRDAQIVFIRNLRPMLSSKVQVFAISPWRRQIGINTMYGPKRHLKPVEVVVTRWRSRVTARGRTEVPGRRLSWRIAAHIARGFVPPAGLLVLGALVAAVWLFGFPHVRVEYGYSGQWSNPTAYHWCRYFGPDPFTVRGTDCPFVVFRDVF